MLGESRRSRGRGNSNQDIIHGGKCTFNKRKTDVTHREIARKKGTEGREWRGGKGEGKEQRTSTLGHGVHAGSCSVRPSQQVTYVVEIPNYSLDKKKKLKLQKVNVFTQIIELQVLNLGSRHIPFVIFSYRLIIIPFGK